MPETKRKLVPDKLMLAGHAWGTGYRHMSRFFSYDFYFHEVCLVCLMYSEGIAGIYGILLLLSLSTTCSIFVCIFFALLGFVNIVISRITRASHEHRTGIS
jgi:hypothetical protein